MTTLSLNLLHLVYSKLHNLKLKLSSDDPAQYLGLSTIELSRVQLELARRRSSEGLMGKEELVREMKENMALQNQAQKWIQVVKIDGFL